MGVTVKDQSETDVSMPTAAFMPWSQEMSIQPMKTKYAVYHCSCVIHNSSSSRGD